jgi:hypothetical protein
MRAQNHEQTLVNLTVAAYWHFSQRDQYVGCFLLGHQVGGLCGSRQTCGSATARELRKTRIFDAARISET